MTLNYYLHSHNNVKKTTKSWYFKKTFDKAILNKYTNSKRCARAQIECKEGYIVQYVVGEILLLTVAKTVLFDQTGMAIASANAEYPLY